MIIVPAGKNAKEGYIIAGAHLLEAFYEAYEEEPNNPQILASFLDGIVAPGVLRIIRYSDYELLQCSRSDYAQFHNMYKLYNDLIEQ